MDLLWENDSPTSEFGEKNITLTNYSAYKLIMIIFIRDTNSILKTTILVSPNESEGTVTMYNAGTGHVVYRSFYFGDTFLCIKKGVKQTNFGDDTPNQINILIPYKIYGIK